MSDDLLRVSDLEQHYGERRLFRGLNLQLQSGQFTTLLGPSGCGKSTLLRLLSGLEKPTRGSVKYHDLSDALSTAMVFQEPRLLPWRNVTDNINLPFELGPAKQNTWGRDRESAAQKLLELVQLTPDTAQQFPHQLSGGMKMRVAMARALATQPKVMFLDEPFSALDEPTRFRMQDELLGLVQKFPKRSHIFVSHSVAEAVFLSDQILVLGFNGERLRTWTRPPHLAKAPETRQRDDFFRVVQDFDLVSNTGGVA